MTQEGHVTFLAFLAVFLIFLITWDTSILSDDNQFMREFVDEDLLSFLGVVMTLSVGLLAQLFLSVAKLEDRLGRGAVTTIRDELKSTARTLILLYFVAFFLVFAKPVIPPSDSILVRPN
jgi:hypothetical protein